MTKVTFGMNQFFTNDMLTNCLGGVLINQRHNRFCLPVMILPIEGLELLQKFFNQVIFGPLFLKMLIV